MTAVRPTLAWRRAPLHTHIDRRLDQVGCDCEPWINDTTRTIIVLHQEHCAALTRRYPT